MSNKDWGKTADRIDRFLIILVIIAINYVFSIFHKWGIL